MLIGGAVVLLLAVLSPTLAFALPPRPTPQPTVAPAPLPGVAGTPIELRVEFPHAWPWTSVGWQDLWTVVQWQDARGAWHGVEGWQGTLDDVVSGEGGAIVGRKGWWVAQADLGKGPFRWIVSRGKGGQTLATSPPFYLPGTNGVGVTVQVSLVP
jgi:hypothetical protein